MYAGTISRLNTSWNGWPRRPACRSISSRSARTAESRVTLSIRSTANLLQPKKGDWLQNPFGIESAIRNEWFYLKNFDTSNPATMARTMLPGLMGLGSVMTFRQAGTPAAKASSRAGRMSSGVSTSIPFPPRASTAL